MKWKFINFLLLLFLAILTAPPAGAQTSEKLQRVATAASPAAAYSNPKARDVMPRTHATTATSRLSTELRHAMPAPTQNLEQQIRTATGGVMLRGNVIYSTPAPGTETYPHLGIWDFTTSGTFSDVYARNLGGYTGVLFNNQYHNYVAQEQNGALTFMHRIYRTTPSWASASMRYLQNTQMPRTLCTDGIAGYGCFPNGKTGTEAGFVFSKLDIDKDVQTVICDLPGVWNACAFGNDGFVYAIDMNGDLYKVSTQNGNPTKVGATGVIPKYISGAVIDRKSGRMFWTVNPADEKGYLYEVNLTTGHATRLCTFADDDEITGLYVPFVANDDAPDAVENLVINFPNGSRSGTIDFKCPTTTFGGNIATGTLTYKILDGSKEIATGECAYGQQMSVPYSVTRDASVTLTVRVSNSAGDGPATKITKFIGKDRPNEPTVTISYANGRFHVQWTPVTTTMNGGYMDLSKLTYSVYRYPGGATVASGITSTELYDTVPAPEGYGKFYYQVRASVDGKNSPWATSNIVSMGYLTPPYTQPFNSYDDFETFTVIDANADNKTFTFDNSEKAVRGNSCYGQDMDDWLITPPVHMEYGKAYKVTFRARNEDGKYPERIEVRMGSGESVQAMTTVVMDTTVIDGNAEWKTYERFIFAPQTGQYYLGFHHCSEPGMYYLYIAVSAPMDGSMPAAATDLLVTGDVNGALKARISGKTPTKDMIGRTLNNITKVVVKRGDKEIATLTGLTPGAPFACDDNAVPAKGINTYTVVCYSTAGEGTPATVSGYVGINIPADVTGLRSEERTIGTATLLWNAPARDCDGKNLGSTPVYYKIVNPSDPTQVYKDSLTETTFTYKVTEGQQKFFQAAVIAYNESGASTGIVSALEPYGNPYTLTYLESFAGANVSSILGVRNIQGAPSQWSIQEEGGVGMRSFDNDGGFMLAKHNEIDCRSMLFTGKIDLGQAANPAIQFATWDYATFDNNGNITVRDSNEIAVAVRVFGTDTWTTILEGSIDKLCNYRHQTWNRISAALDTYKGKTVQIGLIPKAKYYAYTVIDAIKVFDYHPSDLAVTTFSAPELSDPGKDFNLNVSIINNGSKPAAGYKVNFFRSDSDTPVGTLTGKTLAPDSTATFSLPVQLGVETADSLVSYYAVVDFPSDYQKADNTSAKMSVRRRFSYMPAPSNLAASGKRSVHLSWQKPAESIGTITESFEDVDSWSFSNIGEWTLVDGDKGKIGGFTGFEVPGSAPTTQRSFIVFDQRDTPEETRGSYAAHTGFKSINSLYLLDKVTNNDWLISPALDGSPQTISFFARAYNSGISENLQLMYSTTTADTTAFVKAGQVRTINGNWTEITLTLPVGAKYFAVRNVGNDKFMLMLDDFTFRPFTPAIKGYNIYRDGKRINTALIEGYAFTETPPERRSYNYRVTAVYANGRESAPSNIASFTSGVDNLLSGVNVGTTPGHIRISGAEGQPVNVASVSGILCYRGIPCSELDIAVAPGVYTVSISGTTMKIIVK